MIPLLVLGLLASCRDRGAPNPREPAAESLEAAARVRADPLCEEAVAREIVERLGERLQRVSLLAPGSIVRREIRSEYAPLATTALLNRWLADPARAPGREVSSPWPARIEVRCRSRGRWST